MTANLNLFKATIAAALLTEGVTDTGCENLNKIQAAALELGGTGFDKEEGACYVEIAGPENAQQFIDYLDGEDCVEAYDVTVSGDAVPEDADILDLPEETVFGFAIYLDGEEVTYEGVDVDSDEMPEEDEELEESARPVAADEYGVVETLAEAKKRIQVNFTGKKRVKMQCAKGFKYDATAKTCVKIAGDELATRRKASIKALVSRKAGGAALKNRAALRTKKAMKFRSALGLK